MCSPEEKEKKKHLDKWSCGFPDLFLTFIRTFFEKGVSWDLVTLRFVTTETLDHCFGLGRNASPRKTNLVPWHPGLPFSQGRSGTPKRWNPPDPVSYRDFLFLSSVFVVFVVVVTDEKLRWTTFVNNSSTTLLSLGVPGVFIDPSEKFSRTQSVHSWLSV